MANNNQSKKHDRRDDCPKQLEEKLIHRMIATILISLVLVFAALKLAVGVHLQLNPTPLLGVWASLGYFSDLFHFYAFKWLTNTKVISGFPPLLGFFDVSGLLCILPSFRQ